MQKNPRLRCSQKSWSEQGGIWCFFCRDLVPGKRLLRVGGKGINRKIHCWNLKWPQMILVLKVLNWSKKDKIFFKKQMFAKPVWTFVQENSSACKWKICQEWGILLPHAQSSSEWEKKNVDSFTVSRENLFSEACQEVKQIMKKALHFTAAWGKLQWHEFYLPRKPKSFWRKFLPPNSKPCPAVFSASQSPKKLSGKA